VVRHGLPLIFLYVFADQLGLPLPATPALLAVGALAAMGKINGPLALTLAVLACLLADFIWYGVGRARGAPVLQLLCKISLERDTCVRRTQDVFVRYGPRALIVAKFVPGLGIAAAPLAGVVRVAVPRFAAYSVLGALLWIVTWAGLGYLAGGALEQVAAHSLRLGGVGGTAVVVVIAGYVAAKWIRRRRFIRRLRIARISPEELKRALDAGTATQVIDLRSPLDVAGAPFVIPGALHIAPEELEQRHAEIPRDRDVVLYCS
jgi:membrane protein DedA with SNARE-associated domain